MGRLCPGTDSQKGSRPPCLANAPSTSIHRSVLGASWECSPYRAMPVPLLYLTISLLEGLNGFAAAAKAAGAFNWNNLCDDVQDALAAERSHYPACTDCHWMIGDSAARTGLDHSSIAIQRPQRASQTTHATSLAPGRTSLYIRRLTPERVFRGA